MLVKGARADCFKLCLRYSSSFDGITLKDLPAIARTAAGSFFNANRWSLGEHCGILVQFVHSTRKGIERFFRQSTISSWTSTAVF